MVTNLQLVPLAGNAWRLQWDSDDPPYRVFRDGLLIATTSLRSCTVSLSDGELPVLEVLDATEGAPARSYPSRLTLSWFTRAEVAEYRIEEYVDAVWTARATVVNDGTGYHRWQSRVLEDSTEHQFRIIPVGVNGNDGDSIAFVCLMVRIPDPPQGLTFAYAPGTGRVTIAQT